MRSRFLSLPLVFALLAGFVQAVPALASVADSAASSDEFVANDFASALAKAKSFHQRILLVPALTEVSTTWVNADGTSTVDVSGSPVRVRDSSGKYGWRDLDFDLIFTPDGVKATSGLLPLTLSEGGTASEVAATGLVWASNADGTRVGFGWDGALPTPVLVGGRATYSDVLPGVDLVVSLTANGFEQFFVLNKKPSSAVLDALKLPLESTHVTVKDSAGGFEFVNAAGVSEASIGAVSVWDSASLGVTPADVTLPAVDSTVLPSAVISNGASQVLDLVTNNTFFDDASLVYPVVIDPTVAYGDSFDTYVQSDAATTDFSNSTELLVGTYNSGASKYRSYLNFDASGWAGTNIVSASLKLWLNWSWSCTPAPVSVYAATAAGANTRWGLQPSTSANVYVTKSVASGYNSSCAAAFQTMNVTDPITFLAAKNWSTVGLALKASETDNTGWKRFYSANASAHQPQLTVTYNHPPQTPSPVTVSNTRTVNGVLVSPSATPTLSATANDVDYDSLKLSFYYNDYSLGLSNPIAVLLCTTPKVAAGVSATCVSTKTLSNGSSYNIWALAGDIYDSSGPSVSTTIKVDNSIPLPPTINCPLYANNYSNPNVPGKPFDCTITPNSATNATSLNVKLNGESSTYAETTNQTQTLHLFASNIQYQIVAYTTLNNGLISDTATYTVTFGAAGVISPIKTVKTFNSVNLSVFASAQAGALTKSHLQWRVFGDTDWVDDPQSLQTSTLNGVPGVYNQPWDSTVAKVTKNGVVLKPENNVLLQIQVCFDYANPTSTSYCTGDAGIQILRLGHAFGGNLPTTAAGPATVSLLSGEIQLPETDVNIATGAGTFSANRVYYSQKLATDVTNDGFGTGWVNSFTATDTGLSDVAITDGITRPAGGVSVSGVDQTIKIQDGLGEVLTYQKTGTSYTPADDETTQSGLQLNVTTDGVTLTLKDVGGTTTTFTNTTPSGTPTWVVSGVNETGSQFSTCYQTSNDGLTKLLQKLATNTTPCASLLTGSGVTADVRTMTITYGAATTASNNTGGTSTTVGLGDVQHLIKNISYSAYNPATGLQSTTVQNSYQYQLLNGQAVLVTATDNRDNTTTTYTYKTVNLGTTASSSFWPQLTQINQTGFAPYFFEYSADNKLTHTLRGNADGSSGTVIENSYVYNTPTGSLAASTPDLSLTNTTKWGQNTTPAFSAIVFGPQTPLTTPAGNTAIDANTLTAAQLKTGSYIYTDALGRVTNTASYGHDTWLYSATIFNNQGLPQATYTPRDLNRLLTDLQSTPHLNPTDYATLNRYSKPTDLNNPADAVRVISLLDSWSPAIDQSITTLTGAVISGSWRIHTANIYDTGAPNNNINPVTGKNYGLLTSQTNGWVAANATNLDPTVALGSDTAPISTVLNSYDPQANNDTSIDGSGSGWFYGTPTRVQTKDKNGATTSIGITYLNASGQTTQSKGPLTTDTEAVGDTARSLYTVYYTAGFNAVTDCQNKPAWVGLVCKQSTAPPSTSTVHPVTTITGYTTDLQPQTVTESVNQSTGVQIRTTTNSYTAAGLIDTTTISGVGFSDNTPITTQISYQPNGLAYQTTKTVSGATSNTHLSFDAWGRQTSFTNSLGETATTTYKPYGDAGSGLISTYQDPQNSISYQYGGTDANGQTENRANLTTLTVGSDIYKAAYDNFGSIIKQTAPAGLTQEFTYDDQGRLTGMNYGGSDANGNPTTQPWYTFARTFNENSLLATETKPTSSQDSATATSSYSYDTKNRLTGALTLGAAGTTCTNNTYTFDNVGNRTNKTTTSGTATNCATTTQTKTTEYNGYSQISDTGYVYDGFGRNTVIPAANTPTGATTSGTPDLTLSYNLVNQITSINGVTASSYIYDPNGNNLTETTTTAGVTTTTTKHYFGSDTPSFTTSTTGGVTTTEKYSPSLGSGLQSITTTTNGLTTTNYVFTDLQGANFAATTKPTTGYATPPAGINTFDEYGNQTANTQTIGTNQNYGWAGSAHRTTDKNGLILLGARVYNPTTGQFTTTDPVPGGNENAYNYPNNPLSTTDFTGCDGLDWGLILDISLTVAMIAIDCVPGVGEVAMVAQAGFAIYRASKVARVVATVATKAETLVAKAVMRKAAKFVSEKGLRALSKKEVEEQGIKEYVYINPSKLKRYVGETERGLTRQSEHIASKKIRHVGADNGIYLDATGLGFQGRRNLEQTVINGLGGPGKLANSINSVSERYWALRGIPGLKR